MNIPKYVDLYRKELILKNYAQTPWRITPRKWICFFAVMQRLIHRAIKDKRNSDQNVVNTIQDQERNVPHIGFKVVL
jgi:hypothetical protein